MSNSRQLSRLPNNSYSSLINSNRVNLESPSTRPLPPTMGEGFDVDPWFWSLQERILTLPFPGISFQRPRMQLVVFRNNVANSNTNNTRPRPTEQSRQQDSELPWNDQREALKKLKKQIFNPTPRKIIQRLGRFYRQNTVHGDEKEVNEDDEKRCVICLEDFEPKEVVMVTPCNHMFHEDCILPWLKTNGKCPVCRLSFYGRNREETSADSGNTNMVNDRLTNTDSVTSRGTTSTIIQPFWF